MLKWIEKKLLYNERNKHKDLEETGRGLLIDKDPERDIDIRYKGKDYVLTIRRMAE